MTDVAITGATGIASGLGKTATKENLAKAGEQFEAVFTGMMLGAMRKAKLSDSLFESKALDTFRDMQDQKTVQAMATNTPIGIGKAMTDFLARNIEPSQPDLNQVSSTPSR